MRNFDWNLFRHCYASAEAVPVSVCTLKRFASKFLKGACLQILCLRLGCKCVWSRKRWEVVRWTTYIWYASHDLYIIIPTILFYWFCLFFHTKPDLTNHVSVEIFVAFVIEMILERKKDWKPCRKFKCCWNASADDVRPPWFFVHIL